VRVTLGRYWTFVAVEVDGVAASSGGVHGNDAASLDDLVALSRLWRRDRNKIHLRIINGAEGDAAGIRVIG
jgi:hypothetical protein